MFISIIVYSYCAPWIPGMSNSENGSILLLLCCILNIKDILQCNICPTLIVKLQIKSWKFLICVFFPEFLSAE